jgi:hypothetical protein
MLLAQCSCLMTLLMLTLSRAAAADRQAGSLLCCLAFFVPVCLQAAASNAARAMQNEVASSFYCRSLYLYACRQPALMLLVQCSCLMTLHMLTSSRAASMSCQKQTWPR